MKGRKELERCDPRGGQKEQPEESRRDRRGMPGGDGLAM